MAYNSEISKKEQYEIEEGLEGGTHLTSLTTDDVTPESRSRTQTKKGFEYNIGLKFKTLRREYRQIKSVSIKLTDVLKNDSVTDSSVKELYSDWLQNYEQFLHIKDEFISLPCDFDSEYADFAEQVEDMDTYLKTIKLSVEQWFTSRGSEHKKCDSIGPHDSASQASKKSSRSSRASLASSIASARLREEQKRVELITRSSAAKKKHELEMANLKLKFETEELDFNTELAVVNAKSKILNEFQRLEIDGKEIKSDVLKPISPNITCTNKQPNIVYMPTNESDVKQAVNVQQLNPTCEPFVPTHCDVIVNNTGNVNTEGYMSNDTTDMPAINAFVHRDNFISDNPFLNNAKTTPVTVTSPCPQITSINNPHAATQGDIIQSVVRQLRKPVPDIQKFSGDVLEYRKFLRQFENKIVLNSESEEEKLAYLAQFTTGEAHRIVSGFTYTNTQTGYKDAMHELDYRYGRQDVLANAFVKRALAWPPIRADNPKGLDDYAIFLAECNHAVKHVSAVRVLEYPDNLRKLVAKLPFFCHEKWRNIVQQCRMRANEISFQQLTDFVKYEATKAIDPMFGREAMSSLDTDTGARPKRFNQPLSRNRNVFSTTNTNDSTSKESKVTSTTTETKFVNDPKQNCEYCQVTTHSFYDCRKFKSLVIAERIKYLKSSGKCYGCFRKGHLRSECKSKLSCSVCQGKHPTSMHTDRKTYDTDIKQDTINRDEKDSCLKVYSNFSCPVNPNTGAGDGICTMAIVPVRVRMHNSLKEIETYAFLDPGSSISFCTEALMDQLGAQGSNMKINLDTMAEPCTISTNVLKNMEIGDLDFRSPITLTTVYSKDRIPVDKSHIPTKQDLSKWDHLQGINIPELPHASIGLLVGNNIPDAYSPLDVKVGPRGSPHAVRTLLGWVIWNLVRHNDTASTCCVFPVSRTDIISRLDEANRLESLFKDSINRDFPERITEEVIQPSVEDKRFLQIVDNTITQIEGHYQMSLPFRNPDIKLPNNYRLASQRLIGLQKKMEKNSTFHNDYVTFMNKIIDSKFAEKVPEPEITRDDGRVWYIPHHGVYHPKKPTKIRVVFDCAARFMGIALNDLLLQGPNLTNSLLAILLRFRQGEIAFMADVESMFYQVGVPSEDCDYLRFLWWPNGDYHKKPEVYRMVVHLFGAVSSPSCCNAALQRTAMDNIDSFSKTATELIFKSFYVDDCLKSVDSEEQAISLIHEATDLCNRGGFRLTKWSSNNVKVLETVDPDERAKEVKTINLQKDDLPDERALGVHWVVQTDRLGFSISLRNCLPTRRGILSITSSIYDPLGISSPFVLPAKQILQDLCKREFEWDQEITGTDVRKWQQWMEDAPLLETITIPRCYKPGGFDIHRCELHLFSDASERGYGVVAYLRLLDPLGRIHVSFVIAKSRVVPLRKSTVPRLELTAATVAAKFSLMICREIQYNIDRVVFWTDSQAVLNYINSETGRFHTFVANRLAIIREVSEPYQWVYVESKSNPADAASRGQDMKSFQKNETWFDGPSFLWNKDSSWPISEVQYKVPDDDPELRKVVGTTLKKDNALDTLMDHYSSLWKLQRATAWILQSMSNLKKWVNIRKCLFDQIAEKESDPCQRQLKVDIKLKIIKDKHLHHAVEQVKSVRLETEFIDEAQRVLVLHVQRVHFSQEIGVLLTGDTKATNKTLKASPLKKLDPFLLDGVLRVGGRLERANIPFAAKHPIVLPKDSPLSKKILEEIHRTSGHMGRSFVISKSRETYWILGASTLIKSILSKCAVCKKYYAKGGVQKMADLPQDRLLPNHPAFFCTGIDYFGPYEIKRGRSTVKRYGVLFTCMTTRAMHLEVAFSLDMDSCINAIRRFIARRGNVKKIYSDNGTNFVGSQRELKAEIEKWNDTHITKQLQQHGIEWHFNPPTGSHFGGIWERLIRSVRKVLYGLLQENLVRLDDESLSTTFCEVEAILNSRPLTEMPSSPRDLRVLTPNDLLLLHPGTSLPPGVFNERDCYVKRRWKYVQHLANVFWKRWSREYLSILQLRQKWTQPHRNVSVNDLVLLVDSSPRSSWSLARVVEVFMDKKGFVRTVRVRTQSNVLIRPVDKLCLILEADS